MTGPFPTDPNELKALTHCPRCESPRDDRWIAGPFVCGTSPHLRSLRQPTQACQIIAEQRDQLRTGQDVIMAAITETMHERAQRMSREPDMCRLMVTTAREKRQDAVDTHMTAMSNLDRALKVS